MDMHGYDTVVQCKKCGRKQFLDFVNGLKNGWSKCCGETMPILKTTANTDKAVKEAMAFHKERVLAFFREANAPDRN